MSETCSLAILTSFLFLRVHFALKLLIGLCIVGFYTWNIAQYRSSIFQTDDTWHPQLEPRLAHILNVTFLTFSLHLIDRQVKSKSHTHAYIYFKYYQFIHTIINFVVFFNFFFPLFILCRQSI